VDKVMDNMLANPLLGGKYIMLLAHYVEDVVYAVFFLCFKGVVAKNNRSVHAKGY
jgi:hypothetical protein